MLSLSLLVVFGSSCTNQREVGCGAVGSSEDTFAAPRIPRGQPSLFWDRSWEGRTRLVRPHLPPRHLRATEMPLNTCSLRSELLRGFPVHHSLALWPGPAGSFTRAWCQPVLEESCRHPMSPPESPLFTPRDPCLSAGPPQILSSGNFASRLQQLAWYKLADSSFWQKK